MKYELTLLLNEDFNINDSMKGIRDKVKELGGKFDRVENEGTKRLAYSIMNKDFAYYVIVYFTLDSDKRDTLCQYLNINDSVLRYLLLQEREQN